MPSWAKLLLHKTNFKLLCSPKIFAHNPPNKVGSYLPYRIWTQDTQIKIYFDFNQDKKNGEPTIIRIMSHEGGMNPEFGMVYIVPQDDLNTRLKYYCETVME